jgi:hypothetical protein
MTLQAHCSDSNIVQIRIFFKGAISKARNVRLYISKQGICETSTLHNGLDRFKKGLVNGNVDTQFASPKCSTPRVKLNLSIPESIFSRDTGIGVFIVRVGTANRSLQGSFKIGPENSFQ